MVKCRHLTIFPASSLPKTKMAKAQPRRSYTKTELPEPVMQEHEGARLGESVWDLAKRVGVSLVELHFNHLNPAQNIFLREYLGNGRNALNAYRVAYPGSKLGDNGANVEAYRKLNTPGFCSALASIERQCQARLVISLESHLLRLQELSYEAAKRGQFAAAVSAEVSRGKAAGLYITRHEITGKDGAPINGVISPDQLSKLPIEDLQKLNDVLGKLSKTTPASDTP